MTVTLKRTLKYDRSKKINFIKKGLGGSVRITGNPPAAAVYLSCGALRKEFINTTFGQNTAVRSICTGSFGSTWSLGNYLSYSTIAVIPIGRGPGPMRWQITNDILWHVNAGDTQDYSFLSTAHNSPDAVDIVSFKEGSLDSEGNFRTAGYVGLLGAVFTIPEVPQVTSSVVTVDTANVLSASVVADGRYNFFVGNQLRPDKDKMAICGWSSNDAPYAYTQFVTASVWTYDLATTKFSGTLLTDPSIFSVSWAPESVAFDSAGSNIYTTFIVDTSFDSSSYNQVSGSIWKVNTSTGGVSHLFLTSTYDPVTALVPETSVSPKMAIDSSGSPWIAAGVFSDAFYLPDTGDIIVWKVNSTLTSVSSSVLRMPERAYSNVKLIDMKVDDSGNIWVLGNAQIGFGVDPRAVLWRLSGSPAIVSGTLLESFDQVNYPVTAGNSLDIYAGKIPVVACTAYDDVSTTKTRAMLAAVVPPGAPWGYASYTVKQFELTPSIVLPPEVGVEVCASADDIVADYSSESLRIAGTYGYGAPAGRIGFLFDMSYDTRQTLWNVDFSSLGLTLDQNLVLRAVSGSLPV